MRSMFRDCKSLKNIDLSNFNTKNTKEIDDMFLGCESLIKINLINFNIKKLKLIVYIICSRNVNLYKKKI